LAGLIEKSQAENQQTRAQVPVANTQPHEHPKKHKQPKQPQQSSNVLVSIETGIPGTGVLVALPIFAFGASDANRAKFSEDPKESCCCQ